MRQTWVFHTSMTLMYDLAHGFQYSLRPKIIVRVPNFGEIEVPLTIDRVLPSMTLEIEKSNYCGMPTESCGVERLDICSLA